MKLSRRGLFKSLLAAPLAYVANKFPSIEQRWGLNSTVTIERDLRAAEEAAYKYYSGYEVIDIGPSDRAYDWKQR